MRLETVSQLNPSFPEVVDAQSAVGVPSSGHAPLLAGCHNRLSGVIVRQILISSSRMVDALESMGRADMPLERIMSGSILPSAHIMGWGTVWMSCRELTYRRTTSENRPTSFLPMGL
ncbi:MAG: hypothetical protein D8H96_11040 [Lautropia sp.]|nr:MAG: hypothetical protein D8H96_11040 [Lautropia sp.]